MRLVLSASERKRTPQGVKPQMVRIPLAPVTKKHMTSSSLDNHAAGQFGGRWAGRCMPAAAMLEQIQRQEGCSTSGPHKTGPKRNAARLEYTHER